MPFGRGPGGEGGLEGSGRVLSGQGKAVEFGFGYVLKGLGAEGVADSLVEGAELGFVEGVVEAEHRGGVGEFDEAFAGGSADALGGGVGGDERGVGLFEGLELAHEGVVLGVGELGLIEDVIEVFVVAEILAELLNFAHEGQPIGY